MTESEVGCFSNLVIVIDIGSFLKKKNLQSTNGTNFAPLVYLNV